MAHDTGTRPDEEGFAAHRDLRLLDLADALDVLAEDTAALAWNVDDARLRVHLARSIGDFRGAARRLRARVVPPAPLASVIDLPR